MCIFDGNRLTREAFEAIPPGGELMRGIAHVGVMRGDAEVRAVRAAEVDRLALDMARCGWKRDELVRVSLNDPSVPAVSEHAWSMLVMYLIMFYLSSVNS